MEGERDPCPDRILDDAGVGFAMGVVGGSAWHFVRGVRLSPRGERFMGGLTGVRMNAMGVGGSCAAWSSLFSASDCAMVYLRQKEDPWNSIISGATTGAILSLRRGLRSTLGHAVFGGVLLGLMEGINVVCLKYEKSMASEVDPYAWQYGLQQQQETTTTTSNIGSKDVFLESFETPNPYGMHPMDQQVQPQPQPQKNSSWFKGLFGWGN